MTDETNAAIGKRIQALRLTEGYSTERLAELLEVPPQFLASVEQSECEPPVKLLAGVSNIFNVSLDYLVFGDSEASDK